MSSDNRSGALGESLITPEARARSANAFAAWWILVSSGVAIRMYRWLIPRIDEDARLGGLPVPATVLVPEPRCLLAILSIWFYKRDGERGAR